MNERLARQTDTVRAAWKTRGIAKPYRSGFRSLQRDLLQAKRKHNNLAPNEQAEFFRQLNERFLTELRAIVMDITVSERVAGLLLGPASEYFQDLAKDTGKSSYRELGIALGILAIREREKLKKQQP